MGEYGWLIYPAALFGIMQAILRLLAAKDALHDFLGSSH